MKVIIQKIYIEYMKNTQISMCLKRFNHTLGSIQPALAPINNNRSEVGCKVKSHCAMWS